jgi:hypothetical protein
MPYPRCAVRMYLLLKPKEMFTMIISKQKFGSPVAESQLHLSAYVILSVR